MNVQFFKCPPFDFHNHPPHISSHWRQTMKKLVFYNKRQIHCQPLSHVTAMKNRYRLSGWQKIMGLMWIRCTCKTFSSTFLGSLISTVTPTHNNQESIYRHTKPKLFWPCRKDLNSGLVMHEYEAWKYCHIWMYWYKGCGETKCFWELTPPFLTVSLQLHMSNIL